jgi:hypothetical protein
MQLNGLIHWADIGQLTHQALALSPSQVKSPAVNQSKIIWR